MLTLEDVIKAVPASLKKTITQSLVDTINNVSSDPMIAERIRENFISYSSVMQQGKFSTPEYLNAITYVSYKLMGMTNQDAFAKTFPQRHAGMMAKGLTIQDIAPYVSAYNKTKLVMGITEQSLIPVWILNHDVYQRAIAVQADIMAHGKNEIARVAAANSILTHLAKPKEAAVKISMEVRENSGMLELKETLRELAMQQQCLIQQGVATKAVAEAKIIDVTPTE